MKLILTTIAVCLGLSGSAVAQATYPFIGQIMIFSGNFCPTGWHATDGSLLQINQNQVLYSILFNTYGGDGQHTFALPKMQPIYTQTRAALTTCIATQGVVPTQN